MTSNSVVLELRAARPRAPGALRERVSALGEPEPRFSLPRLQWRRVALVAVPACLAVAIGTALIHGALHTSSPGREAARPLHGQTLAPMRKQPQAGLPFERG